MPPSVKLHISRTETGQYLVVVSGEGFVGAENARVGVRVKGDDQWFDETLFPLGEGRVLGGTFVTEATVPSGALNEDWGKDEIYAVAKVEGHGEYKTNVITGSF